MATRRDPLVDSAKTRVHLADDEKPFEIWVKRYKSGRTRVLLPDGFNVVGITNNKVLTDALEIEIVPCNGDKG